MRCKRRSSFGSWISSVIRPATNDAFGAWVCAARGSFRGASSGLRASTNGGGSGSELPVPAVEQSSLGSPSPGDPTQFTLTDCPFPRWNPTFGHLPQHLHLPYPWL
ncbi:hypothetical protein N657DRAFT_86782 [Parathielavia appendiculata]|uniref:Uncharacterized protein n=1 Tax=Parathielavia appendiculata TaxID=2587402 RepID=A0AAN6UBQ0_9PEZI|nr:hypothetical protein N657DRAFT_86782 [Parathielavia appendiculata]